MRARVEILVQPGVELVAFVVCAAVAKRIRAALRAKEFWRGFSGGGVFTKEQNAADDR
jgi:hypothetical protein